MKFMMSFVLILGFSLIASAGQKSTTTEKTKFGGEITQSEVTTLEKVVSDYKTYKGKVVTLEATPKKVCQKSGCWMVLQDGDQMVRTLFKDYGFSVPAHIVGKKVRVQGQMEQKKISAATLRHFMKDEGRKMADIQKVKTGAVKFQFIADAVEIL